MVNFIYKNGISASRKGFLTYKARLLLFILQMLLQFLINLHEIEFGTHTHIFQFCDFSLEQSIFFLFLFKFTEKRVY